MNMTKTKRLDYLDVFRGVGIILMVLGHVGFGDYFRHFIGAFHMPMWFFISGYLSYLKGALNQPTAAYLLKKAKTLLIPYFFFGFFCFGVYTLIKPSYFSFEPIFKLLFFPTQNHEALGALWFLPALFFSDILYFLLFKLVKDEKAKSVIIAVLAIFGNLAPSLFPFRLPFALDTTFVGMGMLHIGFLFSKYESQSFCGKLLNLKPPICIVFSVLFLALIFVNGTVHMRSGQYAFIPLFWINAVGSTLVGVNISKYIFQFKFKLVDPIISWLKDVGSNSVIYLCFNLLVIISISTVAESLTIPLIIFRVAEFMLSMATMWLLSRLIMNTGLKVLVGKF